MGRAISSAFQSGELESGCGSSMASSPPRTAVLVNTRQALSCRGLGLALRRMRGEVRQGETALVVPASDTAMVCAFLRQERARTPVVVVADAGGRFSHAQILVAARLTPDASLDRTYHGRTGLELLSRMAADTTAHAPRHDRTSSQR